MQSRNKHTAKEPGSETRLPVDQVWIGRLSEFIILKHYLTGIYEEKGHSPHLVLTMVSHILCFTSPSSIFFRKSFRLDAIIDFSILLTRG